MIRPFFSYVHFCKCGHMNTSNDATMSKCTFIIGSNKEKYLKNPKSVFFDKEKNAYLEQCGMPISKSHSLPKELEFTQEYSREIFEGIMKGHELSEFFFEVHRNISRIHLALDDVAVKTNLYLRNAGRKRRKK